MTTPPTEPANADQRTREHDAGGTFRLVLEAAPDRLNRPIDIRLKGALKLLLRAFALRCVRIEEGGAA